MTHGAATTAARRSQSPKKPRAAARLLPALLVAAAHARGQSHALDLTAHVNAVRSADLTSGRYAAPLKQIKPDKLTFAYGSAMTATNLCVAINSRQHGVKYGRRNKKTPRAGESRSAASRCKHRGSCSHSDTSRPGKSRVCLSRDSNRATPSC
jgi:hypothetical protein